MAGKAMTRGPTYAELADREHVSSGATRADLAALRALRAEFRAVFAACAAGQGAEVAAQSIPC